MKRPYINQAICRQLARQEYVLRDILRSGGRDNWDHLKSHGHAFASILALIREGEVRALNISRRRFEITAAGRRHIAQLDFASMTGAAT